MKIALFFLAGLFSTSWVGASALVQTVSGDVRVERNGVMSGVQTNQRIEAGSTIHTSNGATTVLRFDDGQMVALSTNTVFRIDGYRFDAAKPEFDRIAMSIFGGAMRFVTGLIGSRNRNAFALKTSTATIGIRGTDGIVGVQPAGVGVPQVGDFLSVNQGAVSSTNLAGSVTFPAGTSGFIASPTSLATFIPASALPPGLSAAFSQLGTLPISGATGAGVGAGTSGSLGGGTAAGAQAASASALGGLGVGSVTAGALVLGAVAASGGSTGTTGTK